MTKLKNPLFSLQARGSLGSALSFDDRLHSPRVRKKPIPTDPCTLPQYYWRTMYGHYTAKWLALSQVQKAAWRSYYPNRSLPLFARYIRYQLTHLPDLLAWYHLDIPVGSTALDSSPFNANGIIYGALPATGVVADAYHFDGVDDYISFGKPDHLSCSLSQITILCHFRRVASQSRHRGLVTKNFWSLRVAGNYINFRIRCSGTTKVCESSFLPWDPTQYRHIAATYDGTLLKLYDGATLKKTETHPVGGSQDATPDYNLILMCRHWLGAGYFVHGDLDEVVIFDEALALSVIKYWSERRYP